MADRFTIDVDTRALLAAINAIPAAVMKHAKPAAKVTAENIAREASRRIARRAAGPTRGRHTAEGIVVEETHTGDGYVILVNAPEMPNLPQWLEFGTQYMTARPFLFNSARLEEGAHDRRMRQAIQAAIDEKGLGE